MFSFVIARMHTVGIIECELSGRFARSDTAFCGVPAYRSPHLLVGPRFLGGGCPVWAFTARFRTEVAVSVVESQFFVEKAEKDSRSFDCLKKLGHRHFPLERISKSVDIGMWRESWAEKKYKTYGKPYGRDVTASAALSD